MNKNRLFIVIVFAVIIFSSSFVFAQSIQERFKDESILRYKIFFNGIPSGHINWKYLGEKLIDGKQAEVLNVSSNAKILQFLNLTSSENVYIDKETHLPVRVERDIVFFGKKELIEEIYNQEKGIVRIIRRNGKVKEDIIRQKTPIHNILALLYFFPGDISLEKSEWMNFNLPKQKIRIKVVKKRMLKTDSGEKETYFLVGRGGRRFNLWLDKKSRLPLRLEFIGVMGKITIVKEEKNIAKNFTR